MIFAIDGTWDCGQPVRPQEEAALSRALRPDDEEACVWIDERQSGLLRVSFDVEAGDYSAALDQGLAELRECARTSALTGEVSQVVAMTDTGQARWPE